MSVRHRFCTFNLNDLWFGIPVAAAQEVIPLGDITPVPLARNDVVGLINLRGRVVTVLDPRHRLGLGRDARNAPFAVVIVRQKNSCIGLRVDEAGEVAEAADDIFEAAPGNLSKESRNLVACICKFPNRLLHVLDLEGLLRGSDEQARVSDNLSRGFPLPMEASEAWQRAGGTENELVSEPVDRKQTAS